MIRLKLLIGFTLLLILALLIQASLPAITGRPAFFMLLFFLVLLLLFAFFIIDRTTKPLQTLQKSMTVMQQQNKVQAMPLIKSGDEVESLSLALSTLISQYIALQTEKQERDAIVRAINEPVIAINGENAVIIFNKAAELMTGLQEQTILGRHIDEVVHFYDKELIVPFTALQEERRKKVDISNAKGERVTVVVRTTSLGKEENSNDFILIFQDISRERELEEMKLDFVSMAAHELRTPLTAIRGYASLLEMQNTRQLDENGRELVKRLMISADTLGSLIDNLLTVSRIERNMFSIATKPIDPLPIIKETLDIVRKLALTREQRLLFNAQNELPVIFADPFRFGEILSNLVENALTYSPTKSTVTIMAEKRDAFLQISVTDTGPGIPKEAIPRLFTKFFRVPGSLEAAAKGTGVGLFITKTIVELHQGKIWAESEVGKGSVFTFLIPIATPRAIAQYQQETKNAPLTAKNGKGIIIRNI